MPIECVVAISGSIVRLDAAAAAAAEGRVEDIRPPLALLTDISTHDQILLTENGTQMDPRRPLSAYITARTQSVSSSPSSRFIFVFSRRWLVEKVVPELLSVSAYDINYCSVEDPAVVLEDVDGLVSDQEWVRALNDARSICSHYLSLGMAYLDASQKRTLACKETHQAMTRQVWAMQAAARNLQKHGNVIYEMCDKFVQAFAAYEKRVQKISKTFEVSLRNLAQVELHPALKAGGGKNTLLDCVSEGKLRQFYARCLRDHGLLSSLSETASSKLKSIEADVRMELEKLSIRDLRSSFNDKSELFDEVSDDDCYPWTILANLKHRLIDMESCNEQQEKLVVSLRKNCEKAGTYVDSAATDLHLTGSSSSSLRSIVLELREMALYEKETVLPELLRLDDSLRHEMTTFSAAQGDLASFFQERLCSVSDIQSQVRQIRSRILGYEETLSKKSQDLIHFDATEKMPQAYYMALIEIVRRQQYGRRFSEFASNAAQFLGQMRANEVEKRMYFARVYGKFLPRDFIDGLNDRPPHCNIHTRQFDLQLPNIDIESLSSIEVAKGILPDSLKNILLESTKDLDSVVIYQRMFELTQSKKCSSPYDSSPFMDFDDGIGSLPSEHRASYQGFIASSLVSRAEQAGPISSKISVACSPTLESDSNVSVSWAPKPNEAIVTETTQELNSEKSKIDDQHYIIDELKTSYENQKKEIEQLQALLVAERKRCDLLEHAKNDAEAQAENLERTLSDGKKEWAATISEQAIAANALENTIRDLQDRLDQMSMSLNDRDSQTGQPDSTHQTLVDNLSDKTKQLDAALAEIQKLKMLIDTQKTELSHCHNQLEKQCGLVQNIESEHEKLTVSTAYLFQENKALEDKIRIMLERSIVLSEFGVGRIALFIPVRDNVYEALNCSSPRRFLSEDSILILQEKGLRDAKFIVGEIIEIQEESVLPFGPNLYELEAGDVFWTVTISLRTDIDVR